MHRLHWIGRRKGYLEGKTPCIKVYDFSNMVPGQTEKLGVGVITLCGWEDLLSDWHDGLHLNDNGRPFVLFTEIPVLGFKIKKTK